MNSEECQRIYGLETEYGIIFWDDNSSERNSTFQLYPTLPEKIETQFLKIIADICAIRYNRSHYNSDRKVMLDFFIKNGSRIYLDVGQHPETSTPECNLLRQVVLYDKANERILEEALKKTNRWLQQNKRNKKCGAKRSSPFWLIKNNSYRNKTYGSHENYLVRRQILCGEKLTKLLIPFLITRQIFCGAGTITKNGFEISQRARFIKKEISDFDHTYYQNNQSSRSIIHFKGRINEVTLADSDLWHRFHLILGDSNMSEYTAWLKLATTALILRMIEDHFLEEFIRIIKPIKCLHQISRDLTCRRKILVIIKEETNNHWRIKKLTAIQIQELYLKQAQNYLSANRGNLSEENYQEFQKTINEWKEVLQKLKVDPMLLKKEIDWIIKKDLLEKYKRRYAIAWNHPDLKILDILYHHIDRSQGLYYLLEQEGKVRRIFDDTEIEKAQNQPPETRAKWRSAVIELVEKKRIPYHSGWNEISLYCRGSNDENEVFSCLDPFYSGPPRPNSKIEKPIKIP